MTSLDTKRERKRYRPMPLKASDIIDQTSQVAYAKHFQVSTLRYHQTPNIIINTTTDIGKAKLILPCMEVDTAE